MQRDILHTDAGERVVHVEGGSVRSAWRGTLGVCCAVRERRVRHVQAQGPPARRRLARPGRKAGLRCAVHSAPPSAIAGDGYGWTEFIDHTPCDDAGCGPFFRRAGAWLASFHCFAATDIHHENLDRRRRPSVPIDVETYPAGRGVSMTSGRIAQPYRAARELIADSVTAVGLLPPTGNRRPGSTPPEASSRSGRPVSG